MMEKTRPSASMERRDFVRRLPMISAGLAVASSTTLAACAGVPYVQPTPGPEGLSFPRSLLDESGQLFVQAPGMQRPIYVRRLASGEAVAVLASCTHNGCQPEPFGDRLVCPCHGSEFAFDGGVLNGPADRPLTRYAVVEEGDRLVVVVGGGIS